MFPQEKLRAAGFQGDIDTSDAVLDEYSRDTSLFVVRPKVVVFPKSTEDVQTLVRFVNSERSQGANYTLTARSAGTDMTGGPLTDSIVVSCTRYMNKIIEVGDDYAISQPGVYFRDLEVALVAKGKIFPSYPASKQLCAVGGIVSNNSGGEKTLAYGKTEQYVESITMVLSDGSVATFTPCDQATLEQKKQAPGREGEVYRAIAEIVTAHAEKLAAAKPKVTKNSSGYYLWNVMHDGLFDMNRVIVGSQGTLGIVTEVKLRTVRPKTFTRLVVAMLPDLSKAPQVIHAFLEQKPESLESYDDHTFTVAMRFIPEILKQMRGAIFSLAFQFIPEAWMALTGGIPKLVILAEFTADIPMEALAHAEAALTSVQKLGIKAHITKTEREAEKYWTFRRESFNLLRKHMRGLRTAPFVDDVVVTPDKLPEFLPKMYAILDKYKLLYTIAGHAGDANFHVIPLMDTREANTAETIKKCMDEVFALIKEEGGSITGEHNDGLIRTSYLPFMFGDDIYQLFLKTKDAFDPQGIFNPGKKVRGDIEAALSHLDTRVV